VTFPRSKTRSTPAWRLFCWFSRATRPSPRAVSPRVDRACQFKWCILAVRATNSMQPARRRESLCEKRSTAGPLQPAVPSTPHSWVAHPGDACNDRKSSLFWPARAPAGALLGCSKVKARSEAQKRQPLLQGRTLQGSTRAVPEGAGSRPRLDVCLSVVGLRRDGAVPAWHRDAET